MALSVLNVQGVFRLSSFSFFKSFGNHALHTRNPLQNLNHINNLRLTFISTLCCNQSGISRPLLSFLASDCKQTPHIRNMFKDFDSVTDFDITVIIGEDSPEYESGRRGGVPVIGGRCRGSG